MAAFKVQPGIISVVIFVLFELLSIPCLDEVLRTLVNTFYYRRIYRARPVHVKGANFPGITHYLLGRRLDGVNLFASLSKGMLLAVIFLIDIRITSRSALVETPKVRMSTFVLNPSDEAWLRPVVYTVPRRLEHSRECVVQNGEQQTYYQIAFNLRDGVLIDNDLGEAGVNTTFQYEINDFTIICLAPGRVKTPAPLARITGCSRVKPQGCSDDSAEVRSAEIPIVEDGAEMFGDSDVFNFTLYDPGAVAATWPEYQNPRFTCLTSWVASNLNNPRRYRNCLLVVRNGTHTITELWRVNRKEEGGLLFVTNYPGAVFEGDLAIERYQSGDLLRTLTIGEGLSWKALSAQLVARSSEFVGNEAVELGSIRTITEIPNWAIILGGVSVFIVLVLFIAVGLKEKGGKRPKPNKLQGLSSILREEHTRTGNSMKQGDAALLGLSWSDRSQSSLRLGIVPNGKGCQQFDEEFEIQ